MESRLNAILARCAMTPRRALDLGTCAFGRAIDASRRAAGRTAPLCADGASHWSRRAPLPNERAPINVPLWTGIRVVDGLLTIGRGARVGIFGAPGSGKSVFVETIVRGCAADAVVVALAGERGREAQRWIALRSDRDDDRLRDQRSGRRTSASLHVTSRSRMPARYAIEGSMSS